MRRPIPNVIGIREPGALDLVQVLLRQGVSVRIPVSGDSMRPLLNGGETVEVVPLKGSTIRLGDIIFFCNQQGNPVIHRLIWQRRCNGTLHFLTKGDSCAGVDGFFPVESAIGRVERIIDKQGEKTICLQTPFMRLQAALIVSDSLFRNAFRRLRKQNFIAAYRNFFV